MNLPSQYIRRKKGWLFFFFKIFFLVAFFFWWMDLLQQKELIKKDGQWEDISAIGISIFLGRPSHERVLHENIFGVTSCLFLSQVSPVLPLLLVTVMR